MIGAGRYALLDWPHISPDAGALLSLHFGSVFYLDQRLGGWRAGLELGQDMLPSVTLNPANDPQIYSALITPSLEEQRDGVLQREVIGRLAPDIARYPYNPFPMSHRVMSRARRVKHALFGGRRIANPPQVIAAE